MPSVAGDNELMPVSDVALWISGREFTGTLAVRRRNIETKFTVRAGRCVQAASTDPREYLGQHLINFGHINEEQLQQAFDTQKETRVPLGRVLVMVEALTEQQLKTVLLFKTREGLLEALTWTEGNWRMTPELEGDPELDCDPAVDLREAVSESAARQAMWGEIRRVFPSDGTRCDVLVDPLTIDSSFDRRLLQQMRAGRSIGEAALELRAMDFQVYARLYDLASRKLVRPLLTSTVRVPSRPLSEVIAQQPAPAPAPLPPVASPSMFPAKPPSSPQAGPAFSSGFVVARPPSSTSLPREESEDIDVNIEEEDEEIDVDISEPAPAAEAGWMPPKPPKPNPDDNFGSYMMVRPERRAEPPGVNVPAEAEDPAKALRIALAGRNWAETLLLSQRILEVDPLDSEAIAAFRVADTQLRRLEKQTLRDDDLERVPHLAMPREQIAQAHLTSKERYVLSRIDGSRSLQQIAAVSPIQRTELLRIVDGFVQRGVLKI